MTSRQQKIEQLHNAIRSTRKRLGLPENGRISMDTLVKSLRDNPPVEELAKYARHLLDSDQPQQSAPAHRPATSSTRKNLFSRPRRGTDSPPPKNPGPDRRRQG